MAATGAPLILDFDRSVRALPGATAIDLADWQEGVRFGCRLRDLRALDAVLAPAWPAQPGVVFLGSGDYHHLTWLLLQRHREHGAPLRVVVYDNHPDNMRYPFGIHCGSWVWHASRLPFVARIDVVGITSTDVTAAHAWENHWRNLCSGRVRYWCVGRDLSWMRWLGRAQSQGFGGSAALLAALAEDLARDTAPIYLSIDKDVLAPEDAHTNWDQGTMRRDALLASIAAFKHRVVGADVTGEVSVYRYRSRFKRLLSGLDGQPAIAPEDLVQWQTEHQAINRAILATLAA